MGPIQALVKYAESEDLHPFMEEITATEKRPIVGVYLGPDGEVECKQMPEGATICGCRAWSRTGTKKQPRPFRDSDVYTIQPGPKRDAYAEVVGKMIEAHPRSVALKAFHTFLQRPRKPRKAWSIKDAIYTPFYNGRPISRIIEHDYDEAEHDPYGLESYENEKTMFNLATGKKCMVSKRRPIRVRGFGSVTSGVTMMSVDDIVTTSHWSQDPKLSIPIDERTMNMHVAAFQQLVNEGGLLAVGNRNSDIGGAERLRYFIWSERNSESGKFIMQVLKGKATLDEVETFASKWSKRKDNICVLGALESMRIVLMNWHHIPLAEVAENLLRYARSCSRDGKVLGIKRLLTLTLPYHRCLDTNGKYDVRAVDKILNERTDRKMVASLVDHIIEGDVFPAQLQSAILIAIAQGDIDDDNIFSYHVVDQLNITENAA